MAQKRMIDKKISLSEKLSELPLGAQLLYTWMIPHADDFGLFQGSPRTLKAQVMPMADVSSTEAKEWVDAMVERGLLQEFNYKGKHFYYIVGFEENQKLRHDMQPYTVLHIELSNNYDANWKKVALVVAECLGKPVTVPASDEIATEDKGSEVKGSEVSRDILSSTPKEPKKESKKAPDTYSDDPVVEYCREKQGIEKRFVNYGKQLQALRRIRDAGYTDDEDVKFVIEEMAAEDFWKASPFDMNQVADNMHKYLNRTVMFKPEKSGEKYYKH